MTVPLAAFSTARTNLTLVVPQYEMTVQIRGMGENRGWIVRHVQSRFGDEEVREQAPLAF